MKSRGEYRIRRRLYPSGKVAWMLSGTDSGGNRVRQCFETEGEALARRDELMIADGNIDSAAKLHRTRLSAEQIAEAEIAFAMFDGKSFLHALRWFKENYREPLRRITVAEAHAEFIAEKTQQNCRPDTIANLKAKAKRLIECFGGWCVGELQEEHVRQLVFRENLSAVSRDNVRRALATFFGWCVGKGYCSKSPVSGIKMIRAERTEPVVLSNEDVEALLKAAKEFKNGALIPFVTISLFAGARPKEVERLKWDDIDLNQRTIVIRGAAAKMRERRILKISPNLVAWLKPFAESKAPIVGRNHRDDWDMVRFKAGFDESAYLARNRGRSRQVRKKPWHADVMRHTAISNHLAKYEQEGRTALWAGNSPEVIHRHYRGLVTKQNANKYWAFKP